MLLDCRIVCHPECREQVPLPCIPSVPTPKKKQTVSLNAVKVVTVFTGFCVCVQSDLSSHCPHSIPRVPGLVIHCINEIEKRGLGTVGLYRVPG